MNEVFLIDMVYPKIYILMWVLVGIISLCLLFLVAYLIYERYFIRQRKYSMAYSNSSVRIFTMNFSTGTIVYFDRMKMSDQKVTTIDAFYRSLNSSSSKLRNWIESYIQGDPQASSYIALPYELKIGRKKKQLMSVYRITSYNEKEQILHFENTLFNSISHRHSRKDSTSYILTKEQLSKIIHQKRHLRNHTLACVCLKLVSYTSEAIKDPSMTSSYTSIYQPLSSIYNLLGKNRLLVFNGDYEALLFDFDIRLRNDIHTLCNHLLSEIQRYFNINAINNLFGVAIGVSFIRSADGLTSAVQVAENCADLAKDKEGNNYIIEGDIASLNMSQDATEIRRIKSIIKNGSFRCSFTPVLSTLDKEDRHLVKIEPYGSEFSSFEALVELASEQGLLTELLNRVFETIYRSLTPGKKESVILPINYTSITATLESLKKHPRIVKRMYFCFEYEDVWNFYQGQGEDKNIEKDLANLQKKCAGIGVELTTSSSEWTKDFLSLFQFYVLALDDKKTSLHTSLRMQSFLISASSQLHNQDVIVADLASNADIELAYQIGFDNFVSTSYAGPSSSLYSPDPFWKSNIKSRSKEDK